jgi:hypothetical protein
MPTPTLANLTGPFDIKDTPVRRILNRIVAGSIYGGIWIAHDIATSPEYVPFGTEAPWTVLRFDLPINRNMLVLERLADGLRN